MKRFTESRFFCLLTEASQTVSSSELQVAYEEFATSLEIEETAESNLLFLHKQLTYTRIEINELNSDSTGLEKKCA